MKTQVVSFTPPQPASGTKKAQPWKGVLSHNGKEYATFDSGVYTGLNVGMWIDASVSEKQNGNFTNRYLDEWKPIEEPKASEPLYSQPPQVPTEVWEAKDRRIAMESSYASAARFMQALAGQSFEPQKITSAGFMALAHNIYRDIQRAGRGDTFDPKVNPSDQRN